MVAPDLNVPSFGQLELGAMVNTALCEARQQLPAVVVGSSLGAIVALECARQGLGAPLVLVAPALGFSERWTEKLPAGDPVTFFHHGEGRDASIHRAFFEGMASSEADRSPPPQQVIVLMGSRDESVPPELVRRTWRQWEESGRLASGSRYAEIPEGDHGLVHSVPRIAAEVLAVVGPRDARD